MITLTAHQPDLFPYPGFWAKLARADMMDLRIFDQFQKHGYQRRVAMRGSWASLTLQCKPSLCPINEVRLAPTAADGMIMAIRGRYQGSRYWNSRGEMVLTWVDEARSDLLWLFNLNLLVETRKYLGITTPFGIAAEAPAGHGIDGILDTCDSYPTTMTYLSGTGATAYLGDDAEARFREHGLRLQWLKYTSPTPDSVLSVIFDSPYPLQTILGGTL